MCAHVRVRCLGRGAFGVASLYRRDDGELVVVKECDVSAYDPRARMKAVAESETLAMLNHPNIVAYYDAFEDHDKFFIEMEYADGGNLRQYIEAQNEQLIPEDDILFFSWQLLSALAHLHECGILHRDIKTENIFLTSHGILKLGDFGISKVLSNDTHAESVVGTPYYMPPEMYKGETYDGKGDVFSAGCVVHELCTLHRTFQATNMGAIMHRVMQRQYAPICDKTYSVALSDTIKWMLQTEASERPTCREILALEVFASRISDFQARLERLVELTEMAGGRKPEATPRLSDEASAVFVSKSTSLWTWGGGKSVTFMTTFTSSNAAQHLAIGSGHCAVGTAEMRVYTWSIAGAISNVDGYSCGQLGHGYITSQRQPKAVEALRRTPCNQVVCGEDFTLCLTKSGKLVGFGSNFNGCLGIGEDVDYMDEAFILPTIVTAAATNNASMSNNPLDITQESEQGAHDVPTQNPSNAVVDISVTTAIPADDRSSETIDDGETEKNTQGDETSGAVCPFDENGNALLPIAIPFFSAKSVTQIACGSSHCAAITEHGQLFTWGVGEYGKLGLGGEDDMFEPQLVELQAGVVPTFVTCGADATAFITATGQLFVTGNNESNKLALNSDGTVLAQLRRGSMAEDGAIEGHIRACYTFTMVRWKLLRSNLVSVSLGDDHMTALTRTGQVISSGANAFGQRGIGDVKHHSSPTVIPQHLIDGRVISVACGDQFCLAVTAEGNLFGWGKAQDQRLGSLSGIITAPRLLPDIHHVSAIAVRGATTLCKTEEVTSSRRMAHSSGSESREGYSNLDPSNASPSPLSSGLGPSFGGGSRSRFAANPFDESEGFTHDTDTFASDDGFPQSRQNDDFGSENEVEDDDDDDDEEALPAWLRAELAGELIPMPDQPIIEKPQVESVMIDNNNSNVGEPKEENALDEDKEWMKKRIHEDSNLAQEDKSTTERKEQTCEAEKIIVEIREGSKYVSSVDDKPTATKHVVEGTPDDQLPDDLESMTPEQLRELVRQQAATIASLKNQVSNFTSIFRAVKHATEIVQHALSTL
eukprot:m.212727 g.212727  ORF g.212727 m.212727 type:complete len:1048 (+) comp16949_c0_seq2:119-3262(+)